MVGVNGIVGAPADQAEGDDILVGIKMMSDDFVELDYVRTFCQALRDAERTSMGIELNAVCAEGVPRAMI